MAYRIVDELASTSSGDFVEDEDEIGNVASDKGGKGRQERGEGERAGILDEEERNEVVFRRLEGLGYRVGQGLVERFVQSLRRGYGIGVENAIGAVMGVEERQGDMGTG